MLISSVGNRVPNDSEALSFHPKSKELESLIIVSLRDFLTSVYVALPDASMASKFARTSPAYPTCFHNGIDIGAKYGTIVVAARAGRAVAVENAPYAYGRWITIEHDNGLITMYAHLSLQSVAVGREVDKGEIIGYMGSTGYSTGSHLHFTVYTTNNFSTKPSKIAGTLPIGATINPFDYLP